MTQLDTYRQLLGHCSTADDFTALYEMLIDDRTIPSKDRWQLVDELKKYKAHQLGE